jgi:dipeptidase E
LTKKIVAVGGGSMAEGATRSIDEEIVRLTGKKNPRALFIPTASSDDLQYWGNFQKVYGDKLGCRPYVLLLLNKKISKKEIAESIEKADLIYVGGGNTLKMMRRWRVLGVDKLLRKAWEKGTVLAGTSAGALCWFQYGHSDSMAYYHPKKWDYIRVKCLGFVPFTLCPHYLKEKRDEHYKNMIKRVGGMGLALDDCTAMEIIDDKYRIISSKKGANGFRIIKKGKNVVEEKLQQKETSTLLSSLKKF